MNLLSYPGPLKRRGAFETVREVGTGLNLIRVVQRDEGKKKDDDEEKERRKLLTQEEKA